MYMIRKILSYSLLIIIIVAAAAAYYYRDQLQPHVTAGYNDAMHLWDTKLKKYIDMDDSTLAREETTSQDLPVVQAESQAESKSAPTDTPKMEMPSATTVTERVTETGSGQTTALVEDVDSYENMLSAYQQNQPTLTPAEEPLVAVAPVQQAGQTEVPASEAAIEVKEEQGEVGNSEVDSSMASTDSQPAASIVIAEAKTTPVISDESPFAPRRLKDTIAVSSGIVEQAEETTANEDREVQSAETELLRSARHHFWLGEFDESVSVYHKLIELEPEEANLYGELGNVYYAKGQWQKAGSAYYDAAERLLARGQMEPVYYLHYVIQGLDPELAEKLKNRMN